MTRQLKTLAGMHVARDVLEAYWDRWGSAMTVRQCFYQLVTNHTLENNRVGYETLVAWLGDMREGEGVPDGLVVPFEWVEDHTRTYAGGSTGSGPLRDYFERQKETFADWYDCDPWEGQEHYVEVFVEKDGLVATLRNLIRRMDFPEVPVNACRGYPSVSFVHDVAERFTREAEVEGRRVTLLYFGDFDPSGEDMVSNLRGGLIGFGCTNLTVAKHALTSAQFEGWFTGSGPDKLPHAPVPVKTSDTRAAEFVRRYGQYGAELDAVPVERLRDILTSEIPPLIDLDAYRKVVEKQEEERDRLRAALEGLELDDGESSHDEERKQTR